MLTFEPDPSHYQSCGALATCCEGAGSVHLARHLPSGNLVALKKFNMERAGDDAALVQYEVRLTRQLRHPHVLGLHAAFVAGPHVVAVLPLMAFGSCRDLLNAHFANGLPEAAVACVLSDALLGLEYIHRRGIVHRAVRASHILVSGSGRACLSGLRYSCPLVENGRWQKALHSFPQSTARNLNWLSPEVLEQNLQGYNEKSDVYSLGVTACELANGAIPFADMPTTLMLTEKVRGCCPQLLDCSTVAECDDDGPGTNEGNGGSGSDAGLLHHGADTLDIREGAGSGRIECTEVVTEYAQRRFSDAFHQMTELCLQRDPVQRPAASQLLQHPFFKNARRTGSGTIRREYEIFFQNFPWGRYVRPSGPQDPPTTKYARYFEAPTHTQAVAVDTKCHHNLPKPRTNSRGQGNKVPEPEDLRVGGNLRRQRALSNLNIPDAYQEDHYALSSDPSFDPRNNGPILKRSPISERDVSKISLNRNVKGTQSRLRSAQMKVFLGEYLDRNSTLTDGSTSEGPGRQKVLQKKTVVLRYPKFLDSRDFLKSASSQDTCPETFPQEKLKSSHKDRITHKLSTSKLFDEKCPVSATNVELKHAEFLSKEFPDHDVGKIKELSERNILPETESHSDKKIPKSATLNIEISRHRGAISKQKPVRPYSTNALGTTLSDDLHQHTAVPKLRNVHAEIYDPSFTESETPGPPAEDPRLQVSKGAFEYSELSSQELLDRNTIKIRESRWRETLGERVAPTDEKTLMSGTRNIEIFRQQGAIPKQKQAHAHSTEMFDDALSEDVHRLRPAVSKVRSLHGHSHFLMGSDSLDYLQDEDPRQEEIISKWDYSFSKLISVDTRKINEVGEQATPTEHKSCSDEKRVMSETHVGISSEKLEHAQYEGGPYIGPLSNQKPSLDVKSGTSKKPHDSDSTSCRPLYTGAIPKRKISRVYFRRDSDSDSDAECDRRYKGWSRPMSEMRRFHSPANIRTRASYYLAPSVEPSLTVGVRRKTTPVDFQEDIRESPKPVAIDVPRYYRAIPKRKTRRSSLDKLDRSPGALSLIRTSRAPTNDAGVSSADPLLSEAARRPFTPFRSDDDTITSAASKDPYSPSIKMERDDTCTGLRSDSDGDNDDSKPDRGSKAVKLLRHSLGRTCIDWNDIARRINPLVAGAVRRRKTPTSKFVNNGKVESESSAGKYLHSTGAISDRKSSKRMSRIPHFLASTRDSQTRFIELLSGRRSQTSNVDNDDSRDSQNSPPGENSSTTSDPDSKRTLKNPGLHANDCSNYNLGVYQRYVLGVLRPSDSPYCIVRSVKEGQRHPSGKRPPPGDQPRFREPEPSHFSSTGPNDKSGKIPIFDFLPSDLSSEELKSDSSDSFYDIDPPRVEPIPGVKFRHSLWIPKHVRPTRHVRNLNSEYWSYRRRDARRMANVYRNWKLPKNSSAAPKHAPLRRAAWGRSIPTSNYCCGAEEHTDSIPLTDSRKVDAYVRSLDRLIDSRRILEDPAPKIDGRFRPVMRWEWYLPATYYLHPIHEINVDTENTTGTYDESSEAEDLTRIFHKLGSDYTLSDPPTVISDHSTQVEPGPSSLPTCPHNGTATEHAASASSDGSLQTEALTRIVPKLESDKLADPSPVMDSRPKQSGLGRLPLLTGYYLPHLISDGDTPSAAYISSDDSRQRAALNKKSLRLDFDHKSADPTHIIDGRPTQNASEMHPSLPISRSKISEERTVFTSHDDSRQTETLTRAPRLDTEHKLLAATPLIGHRTQSVTLPLSVPVSYYLPSNLYSDAETRAGAMQTPRTSEESIRTEDSARVLHKLDNNHVLNYPPTVIGDDRTQGESCPMPLPTSHSVRAESTSSDDSRLHSEHKLTDATLVIGGYRIHSVTRRLSMHPGYYLPPGLFADTESSDTESTAPSSCDNSLQRTYLTRKPFELDSNYELADPSPVLGGRRTKSAFPRLCVPTGHYSEMSEEHTSSASSDESRSSVIVTRIFPQLDSDHKLTDAASVTGGHHKQSVSLRLCLPIGCYLPPNIYCDSDTDNTTGTPEDCRETEDLTKVLHKLDNNYTLNDPPTIIDHRIQVESCLRSLPTSPHSGRGEESTSTSCDDSHLSIDPQVYSKHKLEDLSPVIDGPLTQSVSRRLSLPTSYYIPLDVYSDTVVDSTVGAADDSRETEDATRVLHKLDNDYPLNELPKIIDDDRAHDESCPKSLSIGSHSARVEDRTPSTSFDDSRLTEPNIVPRVLSKHTLANPTPVIDSRLAQSVPHRLALPTDYFLPLDIFTDSDTESTAHLSQDSTLKRAALTRKSSQVDSENKLADPTPVAPRKQSASQRLSLPTGHYSESAEEQTASTSFDDSRLTEANIVPQVHSKHILANLTPVIDDRRTNSVTQQLSKPTDPYSASAEQHTSPSQFAFPETEAMSEIFPQLDNDYKLADPSPGCRTQTTSQRLSLPIDHLSALSGELAVSTSFDNSRQRGTLTRIFPPQLDRTHKSADSTPAIDRRTQAMPQQSSLYACHFSDMAEKPVAFASTSRYESSQRASLTRKSTLQKNSDHNSTDSPTVVGNRRTQILHRQRSLYNNQRDSAEEEMTQSASSDDSRQIPVKRICYLRLFRDFKLAEFNKTELRPRVLRTGYCSDRTGKRTAFLPHDDCRPKTSPSVLPHWLVPPYKRLGLDDIVQEFPWLRYLATFPFDYNPSKSYPFQVRHSQLPRPRHTRVSRRTARTRHRQNDSTAQSTASPCRNSHRRRTKSRRDVPPVHLDIEESTEQVTEVDPRCKGVEASRRVSSSASSKATTRPRQRRLASMLGVLVGCFGRVRACVKQESASRLDSRRAGVSQVRHVHFNLDSIPEAPETSSNGDPYHADERQRTLPSIIVYDSTSSVSSPPRYKPRTLPRKKTARWKKFILYRGRLLRRRPLRTLIEKVPRESQTLTPDLGPRLISLFQRSLPFFEKCDRVDEPGEVSSSIENDSDIESEHSFSSEGSTRIKK